MHCTYNPRDGSKFWSLCQQQLTGKGRCQKKRALGSLHCCHGVHISGVLFFLRLIMKLLLTLKLIF
ncbi:hypothetical protein BRADI_2g21275v3 [Brachypodium distachyon]|uniref:Uncharacterized protein n=1 Tax=Brachypodium distachyon TaxID=15368 RepID=A0A2K2D9R5_BRADI|nr:hypothetical protein BRADI_2g21275v3 [Brachypodium distachyon]